MIWLIIIGAAFIALILTLRYLAFKTMTERVCALDPNSEYCKKHYKRNLEETDDYSRCDIINGETPSGGTKTVICYVNDNNKFVEKKDATKVLVRELDRKNRPVYETWTPIEEFMEDSENYLGDSVEKQY